MLRKAERAAILEEEVLLLQAHPQVGVVFDGSPVVGRVRGAIRVQHFAQNDVGILAADIGIQRDRLEHAVGTLTFGLHGGAAVKSPVGQIGKGRWLLK